MRCSSTELQRGTTPPQDTLKLRLLVGLAHTLRNQYCPVLYFSAYSRSARTISPFRDDHAAGQVVGATRQSLPGKEFCGGNPLRLRGGWRAQPYAAGDGGGSGVGIGVALDHLGNDVAPFLRVDRCLDARQQLLVQ